MRNPEDTVYHGSPKEFDSDYAVPRPNKRTRVENGEEVAIFDQESFHATPHKWIALAYTYKATPREVDGEAVGHYNMGVSLYENTKEIAVYGYGSLEESLHQLYGEGGYLYHFDKDTFIYKEGLGPMEVIAEEPTKPVTVEKIEDPVAELRNLGVTFKFFDLALPENADSRN